MCFWGAVAIVMQPASTCYADRMRTTISVSDPLFESAKRQAEARGVTVSVVVEDALRSYLSPATRRAAPSFRLPTVRGKLVNPDLDLDRTSALLLADDESAYRRK